MGLNGMSAPRLVHQGPGIMNGESYASSSVTGTGDAADSGAAASPVSPDAGGGT